MSNFRILRRPISLGLLTLAACTLGSLPTQASDYGAACAPVCHYETVITYVPKTISYIQYVTLHDSCGRPYQAAKTCYRTIQVGVRKRVLVCDR